MTEIKECKNSWDHNWRDISYVFQTMTDATPQKCLNCDKRRLRYWRRRYPEDYPPTQDNQDE